MGILEDYANTDVGRFHVALGTGVYNTGSGVYNIASRLPDTLTASLDTGTTLIKWAPYLIVGGLILYGLNTISALRSTR